MELLDLRALLDGIDGRNEAHKEDYGCESGWVHWLSGYREQTAGTAGRMKDGPH